MMSFNLERKVFISKIPSVINIKEKGIPQYFDTPYNPGPHGFRGQHRTDGEGRKALLIFPMFDQINGSFNTL